MTEIDPRAALARLVHGNTHFPIVRTATKRQWQDCEDTINTHAKVVAVDREMPYFLTTDMNDHSGKLFNPQGFKRIGGQGIDYIGVRLPTDWRLDPEAQSRLRSVSVLQHKSIHGTIDNHDFYGAKVRVVWADGETVTLWLVTANLGRGEPAEAFTTNLSRIKRAFTGTASFGFQEIDEADRPLEHELLRDEMGYPRFRAVGWGTMNPILVRGLAVKNARISHACDGVRRYTPMRLLVEGSLAEKVKSR